MAISDYLNKLVELKNDLITTLRNKGVEVSDDEKLNTLVPKVDTIKTNPSVQLPSGFVKLDSNYNIVGLTIPEGVTSMFQAQLMDCKKLTSITLPSTLKYLPVKGFAHCTSLTSMMIPDGITSIPTFTFMGCTSLASVIIPDSVTTIYSDAFNGCSALRNVYYKGTQAQWNAIDIRSSGNTSLINATKHYNYVPE